MLPDPLRPRHDMPQDGLMAYSYHHNAGRAPLRSAVGDGDPMGVLLAVPQSAAQPEYPLPPPNPISPALRQLQRLGDCSAGEYGDWPGAGALRGDAFSVRGGEKLRSLRERGRCRSNACESGWC